MSKELESMYNTGKYDEKLSFTEFWGGDKKGKMLQLTQLIFDTHAGPEHMFIQLTLSDAVQLSDRLMQWAMEAKNG